MAGHGDVLPCVICPQTGTAAATVTATATGTATATYTRPLYLLYRSRRRVCLRPGDTASAGTVAARTDR